MLPKWSVSHFVHSPHQSQLRVCQRRRGRRGRSTWVATSSSAVKWEPSSRPSTLTSPLENSVDWWAQSGGTLRPLRKLSMKVKCWILSFITKEIWLQIICGQWDTMSPGFPWNIKLFLSFVVDLERAAKVAEQQERERAVHQNSPRAGTPVGALMGVVPPPTPMGMLSHSMTPMAGNPSQMWWTPLSGATQSCNKKPNC